MSDFTELVDLASSRLGGMALTANDEFFAPKERLLLPHPPVFEPGRYTDRGKWMDGWETRRRREPGHDWCVIRLGVPGLVRGVVLDTTHFRGNAPEACSLEGCLVEDQPEITRVLDASTAWVELLPGTAVEPDALNAFAIDRPERVTHVRLSIHPDGGVARLRVLGEPLVDLRRILRPDGSGDLASVIHGGQVIACSDMFFSSRHHLNAPGDAHDMGDGWETRRRRGPGHDWAVVRLGAAAELRRLEIDTTHFKGNAPESCSVDVCEASDLPLQDPEQSGDGGWHELLPRTKLGPHARHVFDVSAEDGAATHLRLNIFPDGGIARLRAHGRVTDEGWRGHGARLLDASMPDAAERELLACCGSGAWARAVAAARPFRTFDGILAAADRAFEQLAGEDWLEAFRAHPRIGGGQDVSAWSRQEQSTAAEAPAGARAELALANREYEERFGHVFLISATGRSGEDVLASLRSRMENSPEVELEVAADEQRAITRLRLEKMVRP